MKAYARGLRKRKLLKGRLKHPNGGERERNLQWEVAFMNFKHSMGCPLVFVFVFLKLGHKHLLFGKEILLHLKIKNDETKSGDDR